MSTYREHLIRETEGAAHRGQKQCPGCEEWFNSLSYEGLWCSRECYMDDARRCMTEDEDDWRQDR